MHKVIAVLVFVVMIAGINLSIFAKEKQLAEGRVVYLNLAPVDPRSLMQGDYMALRFAMANEVYKALPKEEDSRRWRQNVKASNGHVVVKLDSNKVASFVRISKGEALATNEMLLQYRVRNGKVKFATNAFFFQEGHAERYETARFGQFRVADDGGLLLAAMADEKLNLLGEK